MSTDKLDLSLLFTLLDSLEIDDKYQPEDEIEEGDKVLGELNEQEKKIYIFNQLIDEELSEKENKGTLISSEYERLNELIKIGRELFWYFVRERFELFVYPKGYHCIEIKNGWNVVLSTETEYKQVILLFQG